MFLNKSKQKALSPIIATILLVVVAVILVTIILSFGTNFANNSLDKPKDIFKEDTSLNGFIKSGNYNPDSYSIKNLSNRQIIITGYEIISQGSSSVLNTQIPLSIPLNLNSGGTVIIPLLCAPENSFIVNLLTDDGTYITVPIRNVDYQLNPCSSNEIPDIVCLESEENGSGDTSEDPFVICSVEDFNNIRNGLDKHYKLGRNLDLNVSPYNEDEGFEPIGTCGPLDECWEEDYSYTFTGTFNGNNHIISNLYINRPSTGYIGLFGYTSSDSEIRNLGLEDINVIGGDFEVGGLVGENDGTILDSYSTGYVYGTNYDVGGLVGYNNTGTINNCYSNVSVSGTNEIGGLIGYNDTGSISNSYSTGSVTGSGDYIGGFVGYGYDGTISSSYSIGEVSGTGDYVGGFSGYYEQGEFLNLYWDKQNSGQETSAGDEVGETSRNMQLFETFENWDFDEIWDIDENNSYPYLRINEQIPHPQLTRVVVTADPLPGKYSDFSLNVNLDSLGDIYYTTDGTEPDCSGTDTLYSDAIAITSGTTTINAIGCKAGYDGIISTFEYIFSEYELILTADDLNNIRNNLNGIYFLGADIDMNVSPYNEGEGWDPIGYRCGLEWCGFTGQIFGEGYKISGLYINRPEITSVGLFKFVNSGVMNNIRLEDVNIIGNQNVGSLVGYQYEGTISNCYSTGSVLGTGSNVGGLVGSNASGSISNNSYFSGTVSGTSYIGGLIGSNGYGTISNSYSTATVSGSSQYVGGLVGYINYELNSGNISSCYSTGAISGTNYVGGLIGFIQGNSSLYSMSSNYSTGNVSGTGNYVGGLIGYNGWAKVSYNYSTGDVSGNSYVGGLIGSSSNGAVNYNYSIGDVSGVDYLAGFVGSGAGGGIRYNYALGDVNRSSGSNVTNFGGFIGNNSFVTFRNNYSIGRVSGSGWTPTNKGFSGNAVNGSNYWDTTTSLQTTSASGAAGKTTIQMKTLSTFTRDWDMDTIWDITEGITYPYLRNNTQSPLPE